jgi:hypothetical protein
MLEKARARLLSTGVTALSNVSARAAEKMAAHRLKEVVKLSDGILLSTFVTGCPHARPINVIPGWDMLLQRISLRKYETCKSLTARFLWPFWLSALRLFPCRDMPGGKFLREHICIRKGNQCSGATQPSKKYKY